MCCFARSAHVGFERPEERKASTQIYLGEAFSPTEFAPVHVLVYQNTAKSLVPGGNAMLIHVRTRVLEPSQLIEVGEHDHFFAHMRSVVFPTPPPIRHGPMVYGSAGRGSSRPQAVVVAHANYHVVVAQDIRAIGNVLNQVPTARRPPKTGRLYEWYADTFKPELGWKTLLFCFGHQETKVNVPVMVYYTPWDADVFDVPGIDSHMDGNPLDMSAKVDVDHDIYFGSPRLKIDSVVEYPGVSPNVRQLLSNRVIGKRFRGPLQNGDFVGEIPRLLEASRPTGLPSVERRLLAA